MSAADGPPPGWDRDVEVDESHVRSLLLDLPDHLAALRDQPVHFVAEGWDNSVWRIGDDHAARIPVRPMAAPLVVNEARWVEVATARLHRLAIPVPAPVRLTPAGRHPHPWLLVRWVPGDLVEGTPVETRGDLVPWLDEALEALHHPAPADAPLNPYRGPDLHDLPPPRADVLEAARAVLGATSVTGLLHVHQRACEVEPWSGPRLWCHGDLHPRNLVRGLPGRTGQLGLLDFGDVTAGDPAVDLQVLWTGFDAEQRAGSRAAQRYDEHVHLRAQGWAARFVLGVAGNFPGPFTHTLDHAVRQLLE